MGWMFYPNGEVHEFKGNIPNRPMNYGIPHGTWCKPGDIWLPTITWYYAFGNTWKLRAEDAVPPNIRAMLLLIS